MSKRGVDRNRNEIACCYKRLGEKICRMLASDVEMQIEDTHNDRVQGHKGDSSGEPGACGSRTEVTLPRNSCGVQLSKKVSQGFKTANRPFAGQ